MYFHTFLGLKFEIKVVVAVLMSSGALSVVGGWLLLPAFSHVCSSVHDYVFICSSYKDTSPVGVGPTLIPFECDHFVEDPGSS